MNSGSQLAIEWFESKPRMPSAQSAGRRARGSRRPLPPRAGSTPRPSPGSRSSGTSAAAAGTRARARTGTRTGSLLHLLVEVVGPRGHAGDGGLGTPGSVGDRGDHILAELPQRVDRLGVVPVARDRELHLRHRLVAVDLGIERWKQHTGRERPLAEEVVCPPELRAC